MNERPLRHEPIPRHEPPAAPAHPPFRGYEPPAQVSRLTRPAPRDPAPRTDGDPEAAIGRSDGYWFRQWVDAPDGGSQQDTAGAGSLSGLVGLDGGDVEAFVDQLTPRLRATQDPQLDLLLHLPHLGRIKVQARRLDGGCAWDIGLSGESEEAQARLSSRSGHLEDALAQSLGQPVTVRVTRLEGDD
ncbi:type III secretion protein [Pseudomonas citrulli]|uniref:Type III secretion protein n=1 Tax=Pseudomonas citrulli TaxID=3064347 RepID=A0ABT9BT80_9PSED|nr:type III secretion protein [Pseudomonas sp. K18]MDO7895759.1 type III secretion protein [Pseudomonas sp. K18]